MNGCVHSSYSFVKQYRIVCEIKQAYRISVLHMHSQREQRGPIVQSTKYYCNGVITTINHIIEVSHIARRMKFGMCAKGHSSTGAGVVLVAQLNFVS